MWCATRGYLRSLIILIYITDIANLFSNLSFRLFADDANIFYTSNDINDIESVMHCEMARVLNYCSIDKTHIYDEGSGAGFVGHPPARFARRRAANNSAPRTLIIYVCNVTGIFYALEYFLIEEMCRHYRNNGCFTLFERCS